MDYGNLLRHQHRRFFGRLFHSGAPGQQIRQFALYVFFHGADRADVDHYDHSDRPMAGLLRQHDERYSDLRLPEYRLQCFSVQRFYQNDPQGAGRGGLSGGSERVRRFLPHRDSVDSARERYGRYHGVYVGVERHYDSHVLPDRQLHLDDAVIHL
ncbi:hypothetical protein D1872_241270 [compost metagenome]